MKNSPINHNFNIHLNPRIITMMMVVCTVSACAMGGADMEAYYDAQALPTGAGDIYMLSLGNLAWGQ